MPTFVAPGTASQTPLRWVSASLIALVLLSGCQQQSSQSVDLLLVDGEVFDGTGSEATDNAVGISDQRIVYVGPADGVSARETVSLEGLVLAPGFIDVHNHSVPTILEPGKHLNEGFVRQGVTTVMAGPDGWAPPSAIRQLIDRVAEQPTGTNVATYVGHNGVRSEVMGSSQEAPSEEQLQAMKALVREGMELGAFGLSTGLMYEPGMFSTTDEVVALAEEVTPYGGVYDSHVRDPVWHFVESHSEAIEIGDRADIPSKLGHLKCVGLSNEGKIEEIIARVEAARAGGHEVVSDQYPYDGAATSTLTPLAMISAGIIVVPPELLGAQLGGQSLGDDAMTFDYKRALADPAMRKSLAQASENGINGGFAWLKATGYQSMRITDSDDYPDLVGKYLLEIADERGQEPFDALAQLIIEAQHPVYITLGAIKEWEVEKLMVQPWNMIASDGEYADGEAPVSHPRSTGTFPRFLGHYVRDRQLVPLAEGVRKITALPADYHGITDRGRIAVGNYADLVVFDKSTIRDRSTWTEPGLFSEGVVHVLVNGTFVLRDGEMTGNASGQFVRFAGRKDG
jgi:dihydroorotase/N-acyl-D-amino-acid deacylase